MNPSHSDSNVEAILAAVEDYYGGWYAADAGRMERCLHPGLAKRAVKMDGSGGQSLLTLTKEGMVRATQNGGGTDAPVEKRHWQVTALDVYEEIAAVKVLAGEYVEYIHLARQDGRWQILNVLWTNRRP